MVAGEFPLTCVTVSTGSGVLGHDLVRVNAKARVVIGQDTRVSSGWIADRFLQGLASVGVATWKRGCYHHAGRRLPCALARVRCRRRDFGFSHNPWTDNGIKIFSGVWL